MKGILLKDLYECVCIRKNQLNWIATIALVLILTFVFRTTYVFLLNVMITAPLAGSCAYQFPMEQDEIVNFSKIQMTYPITKKEFILERFLLTLGFIGVSGVFSLILTMVYTYGYRLAALSTTLPVWGMGICFALIFFFRQQCLLSGTRSQGWNRSVHFTHPCSCIRLYPHSGKLRCSDTSVHGQDLLASHSHCRRGSLSDRKLSDLHKNL